jgi:photosystem II stability/assembly factor-like uncharacterized protein
MLKYAQRYAPLLILAFLLVPLHFYVGGSAQQPGQGTKIPALLSKNAPSSALYGIVTLPHGEAWAVGGAYAANPATRGTTGSFPVPAKGIILHYSNNAWAEAEVTELLKLPLFSVSLDSPQDGWAVGWAGTFVHYDGHAWSTRPGPSNFKQNLLGIAMLASRDGWAVGNSGSILHYNGKQWMQVTSPTTVDLRSIALLSPEEGWAVGDSGVILHYHNGAWNVVSPSPTSSTLNGVSFLPNGEGWAVGRQGTILHYRDGTWASVHPASYYRSPSSNQSLDFSDVTMNTIRYGWIAGGQYLLTYSSEVWIERANTIDLSNQLYPDLMLSELNLSAITVSSVGDGWAVGSMQSYSSKNYSSVGVIFRYQAGTWELVFISGPV